MTPAEVHAAIRADLLARAEPHKLPLMQRFFKEEIDAYCTYTPYVRAAAKAHARTFAAWTPKERNALTKALWESGKFEEGAVAIHLYAGMRRHCDLCEWKIWTRWLERHVHNWAHCDTLCAELLGPLLIRHPEWIGEMREWAAAPQVYKRRAALVAPLKGIRKGLFRAEAAGLLEIIAHDRTDIIKKGVVWLKRELAR